VCLLRTFEIFQSAWYLLGEPGDDIERGFDEAHGELREKREANYTRAADHERRPAQHYNRQQ